MDSTSSMLAPSSLANILEVGAGLGLSGVRQVDLRPNMTPVGVPTRGAASRGSGAVVPGDSGGTHRSASRGGGRPCAGTCLQA